MKRDKQHLDELLRLPIAERMRQIAAAEPSHVTAAAITHTLITASSSPQSLDAVYRRMGRHFTQPPALEVYRWSSRHVMPEPRGPRKWAHQEMATRLSGILALSSWQLRTVQRDKSGELYVSYDRGRLYLRTAIELKLGDKVIVSDRDILWGYPYTSRDIHHAWPLDPFDSRG